MEDNLVVTFDYDSYDIATLCIGRKEGNELRVVNIMQGYAASRIYDCLTKGAGIIGKNAQKPIGDLDSVPHYRCPSCFGAVVMYYDDPHYPCCQWCGQKLNWK